MLQYQLHPYQSGTWTDPETKTRKSSSVFKADWRNTLDLIERETDLLGIQGFVVIEVGAHDADIQASRQSLLARASVGYDGVVVSFETKRGPMRFACDAYYQAYTNDMAGWRANVRAVALTLEALRSIDRWGAAQTGQQYTGWLALPAAPAKESTTFPTADAAARWARATLTELTAGDRRPPDVTRMSLADVYRDLVRLLHPDKVGDSADASGLAAAARWERLQNARLLMQSASMM